MLLSILMDNIHISVKSEVFNCHSTLRSLINGQAQINIDRKIVIMVREIFSFLEKNKRAYPYEEEYQIITLIHFAKKHAKTPQNYSNLSSVNSAKFHYKVGFFFKEPSISNVGIIFWGGVKIGLNLPTDSSKKTAHGRRVEVQICENLQTS